MNITWEDYKAKINEVLVECGSAGSLSEAAATVMGFWNTSNDEERWQLRVAEAKAQQEIMAKLAEQKTTPDDKEASNTIYPFRHGA